MPRRKISSKSQWQPCERGVISDMVVHQSEISRSEVSKTVGNAAGILTLGAAIFTASLLYLSNDPKLNERYQAHDPINCVEAEELMAAFCYNDLDSKRMAAVASHLNVCQDCYEAFDHYKLECGICKPKSCSNKSVDARK